MMGIDLAIVDLTERVCHRIQRLTGKTNVWLAFQLTNLSVIVYFVWAALYFPSLPRIARVPVALFCGGVLVALSRSVFKVSIEVAEANAQHRVATGRRNPRRVRDAPLRTAFLTLSILLGVPLVATFIAFRTPLALLSYALVGLTTTVLYLLACDPLPPCRGKVVEWMSGLARRRVTAEPGGSSLFDRPCAQQPANPSPHVVASQSV